MEGNDDFLQGEVATYEGQFTEEAAIDGRYTMGMGRQVARNIQMRLCESYGNAFKDNLRAH
jgi:hypothetical protein